MLQPGDFAVRELPLAPLEAPTAGTLHLWYLDLDRLGTPLQPGAGTAGVASPGPRLRRTVRRFYLRLILGAYLRRPGKDVRILRQTRGKPVLDAQSHDVPLDFSLAASAGACLLGICVAGRIGVDLESAGREAGDPVRLARRYFSAREADALAKLEGPRLQRAFMHTWACKEAVVKAAGHGIANQLCRFTVATDPDRPPRLLHMEGDGGAGWWLGRVHPARGLLGAVAVSAAVTCVKGFRLRLPAG